MRFIITFFLAFTFLFSFELQKPMVYQEYNKEYDSWLMSEKLDGIRAYWNGKELISKNQNKIYAPSWFTKDFPPFPLDGELWTKRDDFENIQSIVLSKNDDKGWENISYNIFEVPNQNGNFYERLSFLELYLKNNPNKYIKIIPQSPIKNSKNLNDFLNKLIEAKAEGVIIKNPNLDYFTGRDSNILKVKKFFDDEAEVIALNLRDDGTLKSLSVKLKNGTIFNLGGGFSNKQRENPPKIGDIVTFKYYGFTKNAKPKFASFLRIREKE
ncbi:DNA ligase [Arcobacter porcinus]|uniref:DNA ligase n=1 Tax=Arcobacter porcinus TaxID=1935204 RepID=A0A5C2HJB9_9BACT|nr:DNA ligase [Arcobacter porcinus]OCL86288.1 DNA ligase [Aliarcobacter thereius]QEP40388.1 DNA ligase [Arcobacter porcinus]